LWQETRSFSVTKDQLRETYFDGTILNFRRHGEPETENLNEPETKLKTKHKNETRTNDILSSQ
jgi:hypothetical protein